MRELFLCLSILGAAIGGAFLSMGLFENRVSGTFIFSVNTLILFGIISVIISVICFHKSQRRE